MEVHTLGFSGDHRTQTILVAPEKLKPPEITAEELSIFEDEEFDNNQTHLAENTSEKRKVQNEIFRAYASRRTAQISKKEIAELSKSKNDDELTVGDIALASQNQIINPRDYQIELYEQAKERNTIAVLETGAGKTHIATLLLRYTLDRELDARSKGTSPRISLFLANTVNLVVQQANVLKCGLDQKVEYLCGGMTENWPRWKWIIFFRTTMVLVCTADVALDFMRMAYLKMTEINVLIFDEAHHAKGNHAYSRIMKEFYRTTVNPLERPRIFGMTASPVDAKDNVKQAVADLECLLDSKIVTASLEALDRNNIVRPTEHIALYERLNHNCRTTFSLIMLSHFGDIAYFRSKITTASMIGSELGSWASDIYWTLECSEEQTSKKVRKLELTLEEIDDSVLKERLNKAISNFKDAHKTVAQYDFGVPSPTLRDLSSKVFLLKEYLDEFYALSGESRCIVFVERRQTAQLLQLIFKHLGGPNLRSATLLGASSSADELKYSAKNQVVTIHRFREGKINCLFSTSVAEEGLDIPKCNLVIRFDLYNKMISYIQSRGRARHKNSVYVHMVEEGNREHRSLIQEVKREEVSMKKSCEDCLRDRVLNGFSDISDVDDNEGEVFEEPSSGVRLTYRSSLIFLARFVSSIPMRNHTSQTHPSYTFESVYSNDPSENTRTGWLCEVTLPEQAPVGSTIGKPHSKKITAKCAAAFKMCKILREKGYLDNQLLSTYRKKLPAMRNAELAVSEKNKGDYLMRVKPECWQIGFGLIPEILYLTVIDVDAGLGRPYQPLGLLTRFRLPHFPSFPLYLESGQQSNVMAVSMLTPLMCSRGECEIFTKFTLTVYNDIYNKVYEKESSKMPYWLVPIRPDSFSTPSDAMLPEKLIDLEQVNDIGKATENGMRWSPEMGSGDLVNKYIVDRFDGGRRFYSTGVNPSFKPHDPVPDEIIANHPKRRFADNILDYSNSLWAKSRTGRVWNPNQPVLRAERIPFRRNFLAKVELYEDDFQKDLTCLICPEPLEISLLSARFVAMCYTFPAIIHRFEEYLIAIEACQSINLNLCPALALEALTKDSDNSGNDTEEKINFRSGMGPNYERLEFLGDCFLKMATSLSVFVMQPDENEFEFHVRRMVMLCNKNLFETAKDLKLYEYIRTKPFNRRKWYPTELVLLRGKKSGDESNTHTLGDKSIADVCEAMIGAAFLQNNKCGEWTPESWDQAVQAVTLFVSSKDHQMQKFTDYRSTYVLPQYQIAPPLASQLDLAKQVEEQHPYHFKYPRLLRSAFMHPSLPYIWERVPNYQRLEFLGDALLDMVFIMHLFYTYPDKDPHWLTEHKTPMVANKFLAAVSVRLGFHAHIRQSSPGLGSEIVHYVEELQEAEKEAEGAVDYWVHIAHEPPKCLADVVEAYVGAIFIDANFNFQVVQDFFDMHLKRYFVDMMLPTYETFSSRHPITRLDNLLKDNLGCQEFRMSAMEMPGTIPGAKPHIVAMVLIHNKVWFDALGTSGRYSRVWAAKAALNDLEGLALMDFRKQYGCDCKIRAGG